MLLNPQIQRTKTIQMNPFTQKFTTMPINLKTGTSTAPVRNIATSSNTQSIPIYAPPDDAKTTTPTVTTVNASDNTVKTIPLGDSPITQNAMITSSSNKPTTNTDYTYYYVGIIGAAIVLVLFLRK